LRQTDAQINGWNNLAASGEQVGMAYNRPYSDYLLAAISYSLEGEDFSLHSTARLLSPIYNRIEIETRPQFRLTAYIPKIRDMSI